MKVGIIYIAIGEYEKFWDIFYPACQAFFCVDAEKGYELFTDSERLLNLSYPNVTAHKVADNGFIVNVSSKSKFMCGIDRQMRQYDYIFYLNGNFRFLSPIYTREVISQCPDFTFTALSFKEYLSKPLEELPYDRNPLSGAYIPVGKGERYYQGGFFGGTYRDIMKFNRWAAQTIENDLHNGIIARFHDESYLNRYLIDKNPLTIDNEYAYYPATTYKGNYKAELIDKAAFFGRDKLFDIRDKYFQANYSFLLNNNGEFNYLGVVQMSGGLGNQLFILAFYFYLKDVLKIEQRLFIDLSLYEHFRFHSGFELQRLFGIDNDVFLTKEMKKSISVIPSFRHSVNDSCRRE